MSRILSRLFVRVAIVLASLSWAGFVFTETIGDPGRGEQIAAAVLADDAARAEVVRPISASVMRSAALAPELRPVVDAEVDRALRDPRGAQAFIDPFAGSWARLLGEEDPRPTEFDLAPLLAQLPAVVTTGVVGDRFPVPGVPLPRTRLGWMDGLRAAVATSVLPLALAAAVMFAAAFAIGDRGRVLRRLGAWAVAAGLVWVAVPPVVVWAARRWAPGADAVVAVALDEATSGLLPVALALVGGGLAAFAISFAVAPAREPARRRADPPRRRAAHPGPQHRPVPARAVPAATRQVPRQRSVGVTAEMPAVDRPTSPVPAVPSRADPDQVSEPDGDALWDYYSS